VPQIIPPTPDPDDQYFWDGVEREVLLLQRCAECSVVRQPPSPMCPHCHSLNWDTQEASGRGEVHSWIVSHHPSQADTSPRIVALIELEEGVRLVSNLQEIEADKVRNDMAVELMFMDFDGIKLPQFRPIENREG